MIFPVLSMVLWFLLYFTDFNLFTSTQMDVLSAGRYSYPISIITTAIRITYQLVFFLSVISNSIRAYIVNGKKPLKHLMQRPNF
ncbi:hypothetical protein [Maribacter antarcticus]|uniref:hypothetical protein n=1 Tax=Maribacter antarcticus TaxID=505250 RepID=UPI0012EB84E9|nr:hypothetical protein [Maribacter antarcticus]